MVFGGFCPLGISVVYLRSFIRVSKSTRAAVTSSGRQELLILVKGGYKPDDVQVRAGTPVRLNFFREESAACTEVTKTWSVRSTGCPAWVPWYRRSS